MDAASVSALVARHGKGLMAFLLGLLDNAADAEDAYQETWLRVMRSGMRGTDPRSSRAYLLKVARSVAVDAYRRRHPAESLDAVDGDGRCALDALPDPSPGPDARYDRQIAGAAVRQAIAALPFRWRQVLLMRIEGEMEFRDIAADMGIPLGTALTWMRRATLEIRRELEDMR